MRYTLKHVDRRLVIAPSLEKALKTYVPNCEIDVLGCVVDTDFFQPAAQIPPESPFIFVMIASLSWRKDHAMMLKAFTQAFKGTSVRLRIAGAGYEGKKLDELKQMIANLGIAHQVELLGLVSQEVLLELIQTSHVLVSSSLVETFGVTGIEALACGKPVVATRSGGPEFYVNETNGLLTEPGDADAFAAAMQQIMTRYDHYDPDRIRAECVSRFSEAAIITRLETVYRDVLAEPGT